ncbi:Protein detoxification 47, chloroplastic [Vitis vinifera]|uniref:Protein detoxification 47, chloroplastic n=1 Tax=Vitis vinifera TaxID=29760 RepID=A0A438I9E9_VITVI|nr:Protein detoxification 47, chloroplastic [Vitis vinifera]
MMFTGPATGLWICGPLMSLIDTAVIGQGSSVELAALGPGTVVCDYMSYVFMFLSIATSNMVATSLARQLNYSQGGLGGACLNSSADGGCWAPCFSRRLNDWELNIVERFLLRLQEWGALYKALELGSQAAFPSSIILNSWVPPKVGFFAWEAT